MKLFLLFFLLLTSPLCIHAVAPELPPNNHCVVYGEADYLLWFANQDGLSYTTVSNASSCSTNLSLDDKDRFINPGWSSGARALIGIQPHQVRWDTNLSYIYYESSTKNTSYASSNSMPTSNATCFAEGSLMLSDSSFELFELFPGPINYKTSGKWKLFFNRLDWEFGRKVILGSDFTLRPFFGLEGLCVNQKLTETTNAVYLSLGNGLPVTDIVQSKNKNYFLGMGSKAGFDGTFHLGKGFAFHGNVAGSILWGHFNINQTYSQTDYYLSGSTIEVGYESIKHSHNASIFNCDLGIGFNWKHSFQQSGRTLGLKFGWEQHFYTNMNRLQNFYIQQVDTANAIYAFDRNLQKGNLSLSGFTFGLIYNY